MMMMNKKVGDGKRLYGKNKSKAKEAHKKNERKNIKFVNPPSQLPCTKTINVFHHWNFYSVTNLKKNF